MFLLQNKRVLLVSLMIFFLLMITSQARNMPKGRTITEESGGDKMVTRTENIAPAAITTKQVEKMVTRTENIAPAAITTKQVEKMVTAKEDLVPTTTTEDLNMMDYSPATKKTPIHN